MKKVALIGAGKMASAIARGWLRNSLLKPQDLVACGRSEASRAKFLKTWPEGTPPPAWSTDSLEVVRMCDTVFLCVKPAQFEELLAHIKPATAGKLLVSVAAGLQVSWIEERVDSTARVARAMPNTPCAAGEGVTGLTLGSRVSPEDLAWLRKLFEALGHVVEIPEDKMNALAAMSGCGPAYVFYFVEALAAAGEKNGLAPEVARLLALGTVKGAVALLEETGQAPGELATQVKTPGGMTAAGWEVLEQGKFAELVHGALGAAHAKANALTSSLPGGS